ncbi:hypothetical protein [Tengunoibacter tsumagoiensis]|uniref:Uncharacterized protein n=1 Tax=Tengunoibacter tsumagoiensis TaxID=2014871 RepID=A0A401ZZ50_9CHLR|nr:hypothetical protein [Tengunoibacter tsumagoiensis]GCE12115.1 hypothetical protein KTT_19740 [Tengunoibacter tsumagoiensis]
MKISTVVQVHFFRERFDVLLCVLVPLFLMIESGYANAWTFAGGALGFDLNTLNALIRGILLETLIYAMFLLVRIFIGKGWKGYLIAFIPGMIGMVAMLVSAGCNLAWVNSSGELTKAIAAISLVLPAPVVEVFKIGLGLLFPVSVGALALLDITRLVHEMFKSLKFQQKAMAAETAEQHIHRIKEERKRATAQAGSEYKEYFEAEAKRMVENVKRGDMSFGLNAIYEDEPESKPVVSTVKPLQIAGPAAPAFGPPSSRRPSMPSAGAPLGPSPFAVPAAGQMMPSAPNDVISGVPTITIDASGSPVPRPNRGAPNFPPRR